MIELERYATDILDGKIIASDKIKRQYEKILNAMYFPQQFHFDAALANRPIEFVERFCKQSQGEIGKPLKLEPFQKAMLQAAFGFVDDLEVRQYHEVLCIIGRKNGKTTLLAAINLYMLIGDGEGAPECYNIATARDQAMKGFTECLNMVRQSPLLAKHIRKRQSDLYCPLNLGYLKALASNTNSLDGLNVHNAIIDELAAIKNRDIYDLMKQAMSSISRKQPMLWCITTNGFVRNSIFDSQYEYASGVINGKIRDDRFLPLIYELDSKNEWDKPEMWIKANPGLGTIKSEKELTDFVEKAKSDPAFKATVMVKDFNMIENDTAAWLSWDQLNNEETFEYSKGGFSYLIGGMDAADSVDLNAAKAICMRPEDDRLYILQKYWIPERKLEEMKNRHSKDDAPYDIWYNRGLLEVVPGNKVNKRVFLDWFLELQDVYDIYPLYIGYDPWHIDDSLLLQFQNAFGKNAMIPVRQGAATLSAPMKELAADFDTKRIIYNNHPIDKYCLVNTYVKTDINGNIQPDKGRNERLRIDGTAALLDAYVVLRDKFEEYTNML